MAQLWWNLPDHTFVRGHEPVCCVHTYMTPIACALLKFTEAPYGSRQLTKPASDFAAYYHCQNPTSPIDSKIFMSLSNASVVR